MTTFADEGEGDIMSFWAALFLAGVTLPPLGTLRVFPLDGEDADPLGERIALGSRGASGERMQMSGAPSSLEGLGLDARGAVM